MKGSFYAPESVMEAVRLKESLPASFFLAGGTTLNVWRSSRPAIAYISLQKLTLNNIEKKDGSFIIGAMVTGSVLGDYFEKEKIYPELVRSCRHIGKNIRNMATVGGSIGSRIARSDLTPVFLALDAQLICAGSEGEFKISLADFIMDNQMPVKPLILSVIIKNDPDITLKSSRYSRNANDNPVVKTVCAYKCINGRLTDVKITAAGISNTITKLVPIELLFEGKDCKNAYEESHSDLEAVFKEMKTPPSDLLGSGSFKKALLASQIQDIFTQEQEECC